MEIEELDYDERFFFEIYRAFKFLYSEGYHGTSFAIMGREPGITMENNVINQTIQIYWLERGYLDVMIKRKKVLGKRSSREFSIRDYFRYFKRENINHSCPSGSLYVLKNNADFMQQNLMKVIRGELWIDELIRQM